MSEFKVTVPFSALRSVSLGYSHTHALPDNTDFPGIRVSREGAGIYHATVLIRADSSGIAVRESVTLVHLLLKLLAVAGLAFEIELLSATVESVSPELSPPTMSRSESGATVSLMETIAITESLATVLTRVVFDTEILALQNREQIPDHVALALDLNYHAVTSATDKTRFLLSMAALDMLTTRTVGDSPAIIKSKIKSKCARKRLRKRLVRTLSACGLNEAEVERVLNSAFTAHAEPRSARIHHYLESRGCKDQTESQVSTWWHVRGRVAHGDAVDEGELKTYAATTSQSLRSAIGQELANGPG